MELNFFDLPQKHVEISDSVFTAPYNESLIHQVVVAQLAGARSGTKAQKTRGEVAGSTRKLWRQKGTGRARVSAASNPLWRSGGVIFAAKPRDFSQKVNRKMYRGALRSVLSELLRAQRLEIFKEFSLTTYKTKDLKAKLKEYGRSKALIVDRMLSDNLLLASRNLPDVHVLEVSHVTLVDLIRSSKILMSEAALKYFEDILQC